MAQYEIRGQGQDSKTFPWPEGKRCAVSLTFDDARLSQADTGIDLLNAYKVKGTFYISPRSAEKRVKQWKAAATDGHEIGNHTVSHPCSGNFAFSRDNALEDYDLSRIAGEMDEANAFILKQIGVKAVSFAYPCGQTFVGRGLDLKSYIPVVAKKFISGRGWLGEDSNDPWFCDMAWLMGMESDGKSFEELKELVDKAAREGKWLVLAGHEIGEGGRQTTLIPSLEKLCEYAQNPDNGIWIDTVESVAKYVLNVREKRGEK